MWRPLVRLREACHATVAGVFLLVSFAATACGGGGTGISGSFGTQTPTCNRHCVSAEYLVPGSTALGEIAAGPDGSLWFGGLTTIGGFIGRITTTGAVTEFPLTSLVQVDGITARPSGDLAFTGLKPSSTRPWVKNGVFGVITTGGAVSWPGLSYPGTRLGSIAPGSDGNLWFTESNGFDIGKITTAGRDSVIHLGTWTSNIAAGPDGNLWFTEQSSNKIGRITTAGVVTEFAIPTALSQPQYIVAGHDGNLWFTEFLGNNIGKVTTTGAITEYALPIARSYPFGIAAGPDGNLYYTEAHGNNIGKFTP